MAGSLDLPECPVCLETMSPPIFLCNTGHSLCHICNNNLIEPVCPICRELMTSMRNWQLEDILNQASMQGKKTSTSAPTKTDAPSTSYVNTSKDSDIMVKVTCPNKSVGCTYKMPKIGLEFHLKECVFRDMDCPHGGVFGKCSWKGKLKDLMAHFEQRHISNCKVSSGSEIHLDKLDLRRLHRYLYLVEHNALLYTITVKIDFFQGKAFWTIQHIGRKADAKQHVYEIEIISHLDRRRKVAFTHHCFNDLMKPDEIFTQAKCAVVPFFVLNNFIKDNKLTFKFSIHKMPSTSEK